MTTATSSPVLSTRDPLDGQSLSVRELSVLSGIKPVTLHSYIAYGFKGLRLPHMRKGRRIYIHEADWREWLQATSLAAIQPKVKTATDSQGAARALGIPCP